MNFRHWAIASTVTLSFSLLTGCGSGSDSTVTVPSPQPSPPVSASFEDMLESTVGEDVPGLILYIDGPDHNFTGAAGLADIESHTAMQEYHQMPAGSAGKKATALLMAMLHTDGLVDIDDPISNYLPDSVMGNIPFSDQMSIRQLLNHTAGVHDYLDDDTAGAWFEAGLASIGELKTDIDALQFIYGKAAYFEPGQGVQYSNSGYLLAGLILDEVLGEHHSVALRNRILIPLGLNNTYYSGIENALGESISGYILEDGEMENTKAFYQSVGVADAPLVTTATDLSRLLRAIMTDDTVVTDDMRELLIGEDSLVDAGFSFDFGLGLFKDTFEGKLAYHHGGAEAGYETRNLYIVDTDTIVTLFSNCHGYSACDNKTDALMAQILAKVLQ